MTRAAARTNTVNASGGGGGTVNDGVLQIQGGVPISGSLLPITDQIGNLLPIKVSATEVAFDVNVGIGVAPSLSYGLHVQSSSGTVLANRYHFAADRYLDGSGVTFPTAVNYTFAMGGVNQLIINNTNVVANNSIGFGTAGTPPSIGSYLTSGYSSNGEYMRLYSGHNAQYALANYQFNVANRTFNNASVLSGTVASIIDIPSHTFSITDAGANTMNYRGISLAYTINNSLPTINVSSGLTIGQTYIILSVGTTSFTAIGASSNTVGVVFTATGAGSGTGTVALASTGLASGIRIDATLTSLNGMGHRAFYYGLSGLASNTTNVGIELENKDAATSGNQRLSPSIRLIGKGWKTNATAESQSVTYDIYVNPIQYTTGPIPQLNFDVTPQSGSRYTIFSIGGSTGINLNPQLAGMNPLITMGSVSLAFGGNTFAATVGGPTTFNAVAFNLGSTAAWTNTSTDRYGYVMGISFAPTSGTATFNAFTYNATINQTGGANGITRGLWINPTLTSAADFRAIDVEQGRVFLKNLRTTAGATGELWNDGGTIKIS